MDSYTPESFNGAKLLGVFENGSPEWHEVRADGIGGSEVGTIMGLNRWESAYYLWLTKTGQLPQKKLDSFAVTLGNVLEPVVLEQLLPKQHPDWEIYYTGTYQHETIPYLHANPDALAKVNGEWVIVECKTSRNYWDEIQPAYIAQVMHYMNIMKVRRAVIVGLVAMDWVEFWIDFDQFEADVIEAQCARFWEKVVKMEKPEWDGSESTYNAMRELHPDIEDTEVEIDGGHQLVLAQRAYNEAEKELLKNKAEVMDLMGKAKHAYVEVDGERIRIASRQAKGKGKPFLIVRGA